MVLLKEAEVAKVLGCSTSRVKQLRLSGKLAYIPGRPVLVDVADLNQFIARERSVKEKKAEKRLETPQELARRIWIVRRAVALTKSRFSDK
ncbi:hypothetical protein M2281_001618 [Mesorhizobium soli]|uniref:helix-turn-helix domain-containing protein n=1 Tax=Pseudaminobacter soli (ex Li et al. 2025) TaxID=1295366 RepID=UPI0024770A4E|nr:helix-turn-helix domain-containing protein [Mesorhizobium soli]MDH6231046.1 hypothetical protein [Mesorhizobium soli]